MSKGFTYRQRTFVGGTDIPVTSTSAGKTLANISTCEAVFVKTVAELLIDCNRGWELDYSRNATINDLNYCYNKNKYKSTISDISQQVSPCLFLRNTVSGCKLFIADLCSYISGGFALKNSSDVLYFDENIVVNTDIQTATGHTNVSGIIMSIIPGSSSQEFGPVFDETFLPSDATRLVGTFNAYTSSTSTDTSQFTNIPTSVYSGTNYYIRVLCTEDCIGLDLSVWTINNSGFPNYFCGNIFGQLFNSSDDYKTSTYGVLVMHYAYTSNQSYVPEANSNYMRFNRYTSSNVTYLGKNAQCSSSFFRPDGSSVLGYTARYHVLLSSIFSDFVQNNNVYNNTQTSIWFPLILYMVCSDVNTDGVIPGSGLKGILRTDLFRHVSCSTAGALLDDNFYCWGTRFAIAWDEENEVIT